VQSYSMGKGKKKVVEATNWEDSTVSNDNETDSTVQINSKVVVPEDDGEESVKSTTSKNKRDSGNVEKQSPREVQSTSNPDFDPYVEAMEGLKQQMADSQKALKTVHSYYTNHKRGIQEVVDTRKQLHEMTRQCREYKTVIKSLRLLEKENDEKLAADVAVIAEQRKELENAKNGVKKNEEKLEEERRNFEKKVKVVEAEQVLKLQEKEEEVEKKFNKQFEKRVKTLEEETKVRQESDGEIISGLEAKNDEVLKKLEVQKGKLDKVERKCKEIEMLKDLYETKNKELEQRLKRADNEFELNTQSTEF
jgi:chromosome segregation ATPase